MAVQGNEQVDPGYFAEVEDLFFDALDLPATERDTWLKSQCEGRDEVYTEVQTLLEAHVASEEFLSESPDLTGIAACPDLSGRRLGSYEVVEEIAKGGMGRIYSADRVDGEYQQRVAIKVVELGNVEADLFRRERQTLANLEHPNIVTLLDGGTLEEGFPYLVMELVEGKAIDLYNIAKGLDKKGIIELFCTLCEVTNQAHQQGVIHCDLKPANILVTENGILKLLDFGISQSLIRTQDRQNEVVEPQALTPEYASPQRQAHQPPHVTDDVYSLGVILGQLLIGGALPRVATELLVKKRYKQTNIDQLLELIHSHELRMIIKKATAAEPSERYQSAYLLSEDLQNWLHQRPVNAVSEERNWRLYTISKNLSRNRNFWISLLVIMCVAGLGAYYWGQHKVAELHENAASAAKQVSTDLTEVLSRTQPSIDIQAELTGLAIKNITKTLDVAPDNVPAAFVLSESYVRLAQLEGHPLYLSRPFTFDAFGYLNEAIVRLNKIKSFMESVGQEEVTGLVAGDTVSQDLVDTHLIRAERLTAEIKMYTESRTKGLEEIAALEKRFDAISFERTERSHILDYARDLLYFAQANLLAKNMEKAQAYLAQAEVQIEKVSAIPVPLEDQEATEGRNFGGPVIERSVEQSERLQEIRDEALKEVRFLKAFYNEQLGYIAFTKGDYQAANRVYQFVSLSDESKDPRMTRVFNRVSNMRACIALSQGDIKSAVALKEDMLLRGAELLNAHPSARRQADSIARLENKQLTLDQQLDCDNPELIVFPLRPVSIDNDN
ncbi:serine/threonine-protein kinase [Leucothrix sargassi]|nr:serine/threonine-protein kinase [Leucothrix sargassi]